MNAGTEQKDRGGRLVLEKNGEIVRTFAWQGQEAHVVQRLDNRRVEIRHDLAELKKLQVAYKELGVVKREEIEKAPLAISGGTLRYINSSAGLDLSRNVVLEEESSKRYYRILVLLLLLFGVGLAVLETRPPNTAKLDQELKQQVVKIAKRIPPPQKSQPVASVEKKIETPQPQPKKAVAIKRLGALAVLGSLKSANQKGGINLGAVNTTAGPGLGGNAGSGGIQTSLYGKGLVAAPVGPGANMQGGGGYGTKGKGGGQAGYGTLSLVGSAGTNPIPLGREAIIAGGLDRDLINDVINRNIGQIRFCYEQGLQGDPSLAGRVAVGFTIAGTGAVRVAGVESTTLNSKLVEDCILMRLKTWKFPLPEGGVDVKVSYPFVLRRTGQG